MDAMLTSFHSSTPAQFNNVVVYSGPPPVKNSKREIPARGQVNMREDEGPLASTGPTEDIVRQPGSSCREEARGMAIVAPGAAEATLNVATTSVDGGRMAEDFTTAWIDGGDLSAECVRCPRDISEWGGIDDCLQFQERETSIGSSFAYIEASAGVPESTAPQVVALGEAQRDTPVEHRKDEFTAAAAAAAAAAATDLLPTDTSIGRGASANFSATHATSKSPLRPSLDLVSPTERNRGEREMFCTGDDDAMQVVKRRKQAGSSSPRDAAEVNDAFRRPAQFESSTSKNQDHVLLAPDGPRDAPSNLGHTPTHSQCAPGHAEADSSDDEIKPWKPRRLRRAFRSIRDIADTGCSPEERSRLSGASNDTSDQHRALLLRNLPHEPQPEPLADAEWRAWSPIFEENVDPSTTPGMDVSPSLGSSCVDQRQTGLERPACKDIAKDRCSSYAERQHCQSQRRPQREHRRWKAPSRAVHSTSVAYPNRSASSISRTPPTRVIKHTRYGASLGAVSGGRDQTRLSQPSNIEDESTWVIEEIISSRRKHGKTFYKVKWKPTWEPAESLQGTADEAIAEFQLMNAGSDHHIVRNKPRCPGY